MDVEILFFVVKPKNEYFVVLTTELYICDQYVTDGSIKGVHERNNQQGGKILSINSRIKDYLDFVFTCAKPSLQHINESFTFVVIENKAGATVGALAIVVTAP